MEDVSYYWKSIFILIQLLYSWLAFLILELLFTRLRKSTDLTSNFWKTSPWNPKFEGIWVPCVIKSKQLQYFQFWTDNLWILPALYMKTFFTESLTQCWTLITFIDNFWNGFVDFSLSLDNLKLRTNRDKKNLCGFRKSTLAL